MVIERLLREHPGSTLNELTRLVASAAGRTVRSTQVANEIARAGAAIIERDGRYWVAEDAPDGAPAIAGHPSPRVRRARVVAFDLETVLRQVVEPPYVERHLYQVGAVRLSRDREWARAEARSFVAWTRLHPEVEPLLVAPEARAKYEAGKRDVPDVLDGFLAFLGGATHLVAYNGTGLDFPVLAALLAKYGRALPAGLELIDGLYLAQALWPVPPNDHRLRTLLERIGEDVGEFFWHDARDDARMLAKLLIAGQRKLGTWSDERRRLVRAVGAGSPPWEMLYDLSRPSPPGQSSTTPPSARSSRASWRPRRRRSANASASARPRRPRRARSPYRPGWATVKGTPTSMPSPTRRSAARPSAGRRRTRWCAACAAGWPREPGPSSRRPRAPARATLS
jgi:ATP-dependent DNA helicase RecQ